MSKTVNVNRLVWRSIKGAEWHVQTLCSSTNVYGWIRKRRATLFWQVIVPSPECANKRVNYSTDGTFVSCHFGDKGEHHARLALKKYVAGQKYE